MDLKEIIDIENKDTNMPWTSYTEGINNESGSSFIMTGGENDRDYDINFINIREADQNFIAMARNVVPELVDEILRLQKILNDISIPF